MKSKLFKQFLIISIKGFAKIKVDFCFLNKIYNWSYVVAYHSNAYYSKESIKSAKSTC